MTQAHPGTVTPNSPGPGNGNGARRQTTVGLAVIGNEVLSAKVRDENTPVLLDRLGLAGVRIGEVALLPDDPARIAQVVRDFADRFDFVVTTGGVGPTHDDCTWKAVAQALGRPLVLHAELVDRIRTRLGRPLTPEQERLAWLPEGTLVLGAEGRWPTLQVANVFVLPGVPSLVVGRVEQICAMLAQPRPELATLYLTVDEWDEVPAIDAVVAAFGDVEIGSYPIFHDADHRLRLTFEGFERDRVAAAVDLLLLRVGVQHLVRLVWREFATDTGSREPAAGPAGLEPRGEARPPPQEPA